jgi:PAS domain S-box-containing protein
MKNKGKTSQKKSIGSRTSQSARRTGSGSGARRCSTALPAGKSTQQTAPAQSEVRFQAVFESSRVAIGVSKAGSHVFVNSAYLDLFGFPAGADLAGKPVLDLIAPEDRDRVRQYILRRERGGSAPSTYETRGLRVDGSAFDMEVSASSYQENGEEHTLVILQDISRRKMAEKELSERGAMLRQIMDTASVAIGLVDKTGRITHANRRMAEMFGRTLEELAGCEYAELVHPSERETGRKNMLALLASEIPSVDLERLYRRKDGTEFWGHLACRRFHDVHGNELGLIGVITDISVRKQVEEALRESEEKFRALVETSYDWIWAVDESGLYTYASPRVKDILGYSPEEVVGRTPFDLMPPKDRERVAAKFRKIMAKKEPLVALENINRHKDGREVILETSGMPIFDREGVFKGYRGIDRDITERKRTEEVLRASENRTRSIVESLPIGMHLYHLEPDGRLVFIGANPSADRILGLDNSIFIGKTIEEAFPLLTETEVPRRYREAAASGKTWHTESIDYHEGSIQGAFEVHAFQTAPNTMAAAFENITERKQAELALKQSEAKYRLLYNETPVLLHSIDRNGTLVEVNDYWLKTLGYERGEVIGRKIADFFTEASRKYAQEVVQPAFFRDGIAKDISYQFVRKNGEVVDVLLSATAERDAAGAVVRSLAVIEDVTERKRAEAALRESEERFKAITMTASDAILLMDDQGKLVHWNPAAERMFGYSAGEALGKDLHLFLAPTRLHKNYREGFDSFVKTGRGPVINRPVELIAVKKDGTEFPIEVSTSAMNINGRWHALGIVRDITDRKRLEQELLKSHKLESIGTLAGGIAHDFNNLLQGIFGYISMAKLTHDQKEKSLAMLEQAEKALHRSVNLTSQLLTFSKGGKPVKKVLALRPLIENSVAFALSGSRNTYEIVIDGSLRAIEADEGQIGQVIQNIVLNADQAMPLGGRITITARNIPASATDCLPGAATGNVLEITIQDQGTGIPAEHLSRIFDPYFTTKEKGSGLGLATTYSIIKNHGGVITVASELGKGTTFTICLPASGASAEREEASARLAVGNKGRILVMDDEQVVREVTAELLRSLGHEVVLADRGEAAVMQYKTAMAEGRPFDIVILDLTVRGGMGGAEAVKKLREVDPNVKAIMSSGYSDDAVTADYRRQGFTAFLKKPYKVEELQSTLNALLA